MSARGFARTPTSHARACGRKSARALHESGRAHAWDRDAAREAGRIGGLRAAARRREREEEKRAAADAEKTFEDERKRELAARTLGPKDDDDGC